MAGARRGARASGQIEPSSREPPPCPSRPDLDPIPPVLAGADTLVPRASSERLLARFAPGVAVRRVVPGASHNDVSSRSDYFAGWQR